MNQILTNSLSIFATMLVAASAVLAHAKLESSVPAAGSTVNEPPTTVELRFSVRIQAAMSSISVVEMSSGASLPVGPLEVANAGKTISVTLPKIEAGTYQVEWKALSADDHMIEGRFEFYVGTKGPETVAVSKIPDHGRMDHSSTQREAEVSWPQSLVRWATYVGMMLLTGGLGFRLFVADDDLVNSDLFNARLIVLLAAASILLLTGLMIALALQTKIVTGAVDPPGAMSILRETTFGPPWIMQAASVVLALLLILVTRTTLRPKLFSAAFVLSLITLLGSSLSGHARAAANEYSFAIIADWLHLAAASVWIGGLFVIAIAVPPALRGIDPNAACERLGNWIRRFTRLAIPAVILVALTGLYNSWIHVDGFPALIETRYGQVLLIKVAIAGVMVVLGGINGLLLQRRLHAGSSGSENKAGSRLFRNVKVEGLLALAVLLLAALLAFLPPAREHIPIEGSAPSWIGNNVNKR